jgi:hypothetical protein
MRTADTYPIGFWNYTDITNPNGSRVQDWVDAGMTIAHTPRYVAGAGNKEKMVAVLDEAGRRGIGCILWDERLSAWWPDKLDEAELRRALDAVIADFGSHPAVIGFHVTDEPGVWGDVEVDASRFVYRATKERVPHLRPFLNLHPWHMTGFSTSGLMSRPGKRYVDVLDEYVKAVGMDYLCYDCYSQMKEGDSGFNMYFRNLEMYREAARRNNIPYWTTLLCAGHFRYRPPTEDDYRWQVSTAAAHGAQGILWFHLYLMRGDSDYRGAPIDEHWERTESFAWMSRVNRTFQRMYGGLLMRLRLESVYHINRTYGGVPLFEEGCDDLVFCTHIPGEQGAILSRFTHEDGGRYYALTNNSQTQSVEGIIRFRADGIELREVGWDGPGTAPAGRVEEYHGDLDSWRGVRSIRVGDWLKPGQMRMWKVVETDRGAGRGSARR